MSETVCSVQWCAACAYADGRCAVHVAVETFKPADVNVCPDYWRELEEHWDSLHGPTPFTADPEPPKKACEFCEEGECPCCGGSGHLECHNHAHCDEHHECEPCSGAGKCQHCNGSGVEGLRAAKSSRYSRKRKKQDDADDLPEETRQWLNRRPSQRRAA